MYLINFCITDKLQQQLWARVRRAAGLHWPLPGLCAGGRRGEVSDSLCISWSERTELVRRLVCILFWGWGGGIGASLLTCSRQLSYRLHECKNRKGVGVRIIWDLQHLKQNNTRELHPSPSRCPCTGGVNCEGIGLRGVGGWNPLPPQRSATWVFHLELFT